MHFSVVTTSTLHLGSSFEGACVGACVGVVLFDLHVFVSAFAKKKKKRRKKKLT